MTVVSSGNTITFAGDGVQTSFDFNFRIFREDDLCAVLRSSSGEERKLNLGSDFLIVSGVGSDSGGRVSYPVSGSPLSEGETITLYREIPYSQELELVDNDPFSASLLNEAFDRGVMRDQQLQEQVDRALKYDISTPLEEQLSPQEFMRSVRQTRDSVSESMEAAETARAGAVEAENGACRAESGAQDARSGAEAARDEAQAARDAAREIALGDVAALRSPTPVLSGPVEAAEGTAISIQIMDYQEDPVTSYDIDVSGFGSVSIAGGEISWQLGNVDADANRSIEVLRRKRGEFHSELARHTVLVRKVAVQDGPTVVFADSSAGWDKEPDQEGIQPPARSVAAENTNQVASALMEITYTGSEIAVLAGTTADALQLAEPVAVNEFLITDQGETCVESVSIDATPSRTISDLSLWDGKTSGFIFSSGTIGNAGGSGNSSVRSSSIISGDFEFRFRPKANGGGNETSIGFFPAAELSKFNPDNYFQRSVGFSKFVEFLVNTGGVTSPFNGTLFEPAENTSGWSCDSDQVLILQREGTHVRLIREDNQGSRTTIKNTYLVFDEDVYLYVGMYSGANDNYQKLENVAWDSVQTKHTASVNPSLSGTPTKVFRNPLWRPLALTGTQSVTTLKTLDEVVQGEKLKLPEKEVIAGVVAEEVINTVSDQQPFGDGSCLGTYPMDNAGNCPSIGPNGDTISSGVVRWEPGKYGEGAVITPTTAKDYGITVDFADFGVSWWVNTQKGDTPNSALCFGSSTGYLALWVNPDANVSVPVTGVGALTFDTALVNDGQDHHFVVSGNSTDGVKVYLDGNVVCSSGAYTPGTPKSLWQLGYGANSAGMYYDQLRFFNRELTQEDVQKLMNEESKNYSVDLTHENLTQVPTSAAKRSNVALKLGTGVVGEYLGPEVPLSLKKVQNVIPDMNAATTQGCTITASSILSQDYVAWLAGAHDHPNWGWIADNSLSPQTLTCLFDSPVDIYEYEIQAINLNSVDYKGTPTEFSVEIYDGSTWMQVDYQSGLANWSQEEKRKFTLSALQENCYGIRINCIDAERPEYKSIGQFSVFPKAESTASALVFESSESIKDRIFVSGGLHNDIEIDGGRHELSAVAENTTQITEGVTPARDFYSYGYVHKYYVNNRVKVPNGKTISELGIWTDSENTVPYRLCIFKKLSGDNLEIVARTASHAFSTGEEWQPLESPFTVPQTGDYYVGAGVPSGANEGRITWPEATDPFSGWLCEDFASDALGSTGAFTLYQYTSNVGYRFAGSLYTTTATLVTPLAQAPTGTETVIIPDRCNLSPASLAAQVAGGELKITSDMITLEQDPNLKRLAMAVNGPSEMRFKSGKIYIKENV